MKIFAIVFCLFLSLNTLAQSGDTVPKDTSRVSLKHDMPSITKRFKFLSVIDNKLYYRRSLKKRLVRHPSDILDVNVLKGKEGTEKYGELGAHGVVVVTTKSYAIKSYQNKFSSLSNYYKNYLNKNKNDDLGLVYVLNGDVLESKQYEAIKRMYEALDQIKTVDFIDKYSKKLD